MEQQIALVFTWDPKARAWLKERGPEDAAPPPAAPIDDGAVQTYFLDPSNGRWQATILGLRARQIAAELGNAYRSPFVAGLALREAAAVNPRLVVEREGDSVAGSASRRALRFVGAALVLVVLIGGGAIAANAILAPSSAEADATPLTTPTRTSAGVATDASATPAPTGTASATAAQTDAPAAVSVRTSTPVTAPTAQQIVTVTYSTVLSSGVRLTYSGPNAVVQQSVLYMTFRAYQPNGQPAFDNLTVYLGTGAAAQALTVTADRTGLYNAALKVTLPKGDQVLSVRFGPGGDQKALGTISVR